ncbi:glycoside hydrolase family 16 protein [Sulfoacidibacillus thermotolerans]|uniref:GH16 domain-containing protein n=1 Tax=Sulfoacidibacillus thermotolerans TaxID=1765684 RepID=A0A2U3D6U0_SULT2|nr:glycoside hydrolase family 16 protein [Sulfoacidibacillus thermotolerans]PWI56996.1 hypothetical protein BM613_10980 [Sulfoacidibacillus thermotolerans]
MRHISWMPLLLVTVCSGLLASMMLVKTSVLENSSTQSVKPHTKINVGKSRTDSTSTTPNVWNEWNTGHVFNDELEYYTPEAVTFKGQGLTITASKEKMGAKNFVSGRIDEKDHPFEYGDIVAIMKLPTGTGMFPALWLRPANGGILPEIDIMENIGRDPNVIVPAYHETSGGDIFTRYYLINPNQFHTYTLIWQPHLLEWSIDGHVILKVTKNIPHQPMYATINLAIGGTWPHNPTNQTKFPQAFVIRRIIIYPDKGPSIVGNKLVKST